MEFNSFFSDTISYIRVKTAWGMAAVGVTGETTAQTTTAVENTKKTLNNTPNRTTMPTCHCVVNVFIVWMEFDPFFSTPYHTYARKRRGGWRRRGLQANACSSKNGGRKHKNKLNEQNGGWATQPHHNADMHLFCKRVHWMDGWMGFNGRSRLSPSTTPISSCAKAA